MLDLEKWAKDHAPGTSKTAIATVGPSGSPSLTGFDMVYAITQDTVNSQFQWLQLSDIIPSEIRVGDLATDGIFIGGDGADAATIDPPTVDFDTGSSRQARMLLSFTGGALHYYKGFGANQTVVRVPVQGWKLALNVNLNLGQIAHADIVAGLPVPAEIQKILTAFDPAMLQVSSIFMDFQNSDLANYDSIHTVMNTTDLLLKQVFAERIGAWLKGKQGKDNPFILGYPVTRTSPPDDIKAVFQPTGANLSVHAYQYPPGSTDQSKNGLSTLNFLLVSGNRKITDEAALFAPDAGTFHRNLVEDPKIDGKAIIGKGLFQENYLYRLIVKPIQDLINAQTDYTGARPDKDTTAEINEKTSPISGRATFEPTATGWHYSDHVKLTWHESGFYSHDRESEQKIDFKIDFGTQAGADNAQHPTLVITSTLYRYEWDQQNEDIPPFKKNVYVGKAWANATLVWTLTLQFIAGKDGKITITKASSVPDPTTDSGDAGAYKIADAFTNLLGLDGIKGAWNSKGASLGAIESGVANQFITDIGTVLDGAMAHLVMPARSQFFYKNIQINADGDIELDITYKSEG